jgi:2-polyprenyl-6-methoxyphenol hydroxylase-like FAD-dependent oxidoreductase
MKLKKIIIAGAGIGGLSAGIALRRVGFEVEIYEKAPNLSPPIGWGLALAPNALLALNHIGLAESVIQAGSKIRRVQMKTKLGTTLKEIPLETLEARTGGSIVTLNRSRLHTLLLGAFGESGLHLGNGASCYTETQKQVVLTLENGQEVEGDLLIGADGIRSSIRRQLFPHAKIQYRYAAWRGLCSANLLTNGTYLSVLGRGTRFGCTHMGDGNLSWYATYLAPENQVITSPQAELKRYQNWCLPIPEIIKNTPEKAILHTQVYDAEPLSTWSSERVTLLGDAAHPMTPDMNQGAGQAIEDGIILADSLEKSSNLQEALKLYEFYRIKRTSKIVKQSRQSGQIEHSNNFITSSIRNAIYHFTPVELLLKQMVIVSKFDI